MRYRSRWSTHFKISLLEMPDFSTSSSRPLREAPAFSRSRQVTKPDRLQLLGESGPNSLDIFQCILEFGDFVQVRRIKFPGDGGFRNLFHQLFGSRIHLRHCWRKLCFRCAYSRRSIHRFGHLLLCCSRGHNQHFCLFCGALIGLTDQCDRPCSHSSSRSTRCAACC